MRCKFCCGEVELNDSNEYICSKCGKKINAEILISLKVMTRLAVC